MHELRIMGVRSGGRTRVGTIRFMHPDELLPHHRLPVMLFDAMDWAKDNLIGMTEPKRLPGIGAAYHDHEMYYVRYYIEEDYIDNLKERS